MFRKYSFTGSLLVSLLLACPVAAVGPPGATAGDLKRWQAELRTSKDPQRLQDAAVFLCQKGPPCSVARVARLLTDPDFLTRLDADRSYKWATHTLRMRRVVGAVGERGDAEAEQALVMLAYDKEFTAHPVRRKALIEAAGNVRAPSDKLLAWLDTSPVPGTDGGVPAALARMRSPKACAVLEKWIRVPGNNKIGWFISGILPVRDDPAILGLYRRVLTKGVRDSRLRKYVVLSLFHYDREWYGGPALTYDRPQPPSWKRSPSASLREVLSLADLALKLDLDEPTKAKVRATKAEIGAILARRARATPARLARLIAELDSNDFEVREAASGALRGLAETAEPALRLELNRARSLEARRRIQELLRALEEDL